MDCVHFLLAPAISGPILGTDEIHRQWLVHHCGTRACHIHTDHGNRRRGQGLTWRRCHRASGRREPERERGGSVALASKICTGTDR